MPNESPSATGAERHAPAPVAPPQSLPRLRGAKFRNVRVGAGEQLRVWGWVEQGQPRLRFELWHRSNDGRWRYSHSASSTRGEIATALALALQLGSLPEALAEQP